MARRRRGRPINGILLLNKGLDVTSNGALQVAKSLFAAAKAGHTGSLDPLATGMLPICFGEATKFSQFLLDSDKTYQVTAKLGVTTETGDSEGDIVERHAVSVTLAQLEAALEPLRGDIEQVPSMYSALKHNGEPLYKLARQGIEVERPARPVTIYRLELLDFRPDQDEVDLEVECSKGTYIRSLVEDLGNALGCGGHVTKLHRLAVGSYPEANMMTMDELGALKKAGGFEAIDEKLLPLSSSVADWPAVQLGDDAAFYVLRGQAVMANDRPSHGGVAIFRASDGEFLGVGEVQEDGLIAPKRLLSQ